MASGLPIISTPCEGTKELISQNGIIIQDATPETITNGIVEITNNPSQYNNMSECSRITAEQFSWANTTEQYLRLYINI